DFLYKPGTTPETFPIGRIGKAARSSKKGGDSQSNTQDNPLMDFIRQHGSYLTPTSSLDIVSFIAVMVRGVLVSLTVYFCFLVVLMSFLQLGHLFKNEFVSGCVSQ